MPFFNKQKFSSKSLLDNYFTFPRSWANARRINLSLKSKEENIFKENLQQEYFNYTLKVKETGIELKGKIPLLSNIHKEDILEWIDNFRRITRKAGWNEDESLQVLRNIIPD
ncbi:hypothetical protein DMUE_4183 [Dictyocoela muelleri]|nr:hypothetical protein DMUE_4183 [Dictyocoela muelleri]